MFTCSEMLLGSAFWCGISSHRLVVSSSHPNSTPLLPQPSLFGASFTSKMERGVSCCTRSSLIILCSGELAMHTAVHQSVPRVNARIFALDLDGRFGRFGVEHEVVVAVRAVFVATPHSANVPHSLCADTHASSNSRASLRNAFLHFLHIKVMSNVCISGWSACSAWHSAQSNHFLPGCHEPSFCSKHCGGPTAWRADGNLGVQDVFAAACVSGGGDTGSLYGQGSRVLTTWLGGDGEVSLACGPNKLTMLGERAGRFVPSCCYSLGA